ncbi:bifunctional sugar-1-phosphate nucleotidylyltransferase/acetyltransferase [Halorubrum sp. DTA98]|uniref:bifunctional sugar-1-phosphate nucleotidylyltransferase/acetyltransferase n=1 Tax=Halorubrum sp. DTA98 TaxID=3402163 RepID=UPI003AAB385C
MQVVILAAGRGTRMGPLTETIPKPMLPVADRPLVAHVADAAVDAGAEELVLTVGYGGDQVREYFGERYAGVPVHYAEQSDQLGTADALRVAVDHVDGPFAVLNGDNLCRAADLDTLFDAVPAVGAYRVDDPSSYGVLRTENGVVTEVVEKPDNPETNTINAGAYAFPADVVDLLDVPRSERGERELTDVLDRVIERDTVSAVDFEEWMDVGHPWELLAANERRLPTPDRGRADGGTETTTTGGIRSHKLVDFGAPDGDVHPDATIRGDVVRESGVQVGPGVVIEGPVLLRSGCSIGPNAYVRGPTLVGPGARIGHAVEVKNSVVMADASIGHLSYVGDSIVGPRVNLGAGTNVANLRHDGEPVSVTVGDRRVSTGRRKFGTVLGPDVKTGIQTGIHPGVTLSAGVRTTPGEIVSRDR